MSSKSFSKNKFSKVEKKWIDDYLINYGLFMHEKIDYE
jgi:hypothetical protein